MKNLVSLAFALTAGLCLTQIAAAQIPPVAKINPNSIKNLSGQAFLNEYADRLEANLKGRSVGYSFTIVSKDEPGLVSRAGGDARRAPDSNPRKMTADDKFSIASVSKTITAAAVLRLLHERNLDLDSPVYPYLPPDWSLGSTVKSITFRELLTHRSGIRCTTDVTYTAMKECLGGGVRPIFKKEQSYNNTNFGLFRLIIARLFAPSEKFDFPSDQQASAAYARIYRIYVREVVFPKVSLKDIDLKPVAENPALAYQYPSPIAAGDSFGDLTERSGSQGWFMSSKELAVFVNGLLWTEKILPKAVSAQMKNGQLGLWRVANGGNTVGYEHGGYYPGKDEKGNAYNKGEMNTLIIAFDNGVSVALIINSQFGPNESFDNLVQQIMQQMKK